MRVLDARRASDVNSALGFGLPGPATVAAEPGLRAGGAADRSVALVVQGVVREVVFEDVAPDVLLRPVGERVELPDAAPPVALQLGRRRPGRRLLAADPGDPGV